MCLPCSSLSLLGVSCVDAVGSNAKEKPGGVFDGLLYLHEEGDGLFAVDEAVVVA
jgi:hypothetical protein